MKLEECVVELVRKVNYSFTICEKETFEAAKIISDVIRILHIISLRHPSVFKKTLTGFNCFFDAKEWEKSVKDEHCLDQDGIAKCYAANATNRYFKRYWADLCSTILSKNYSRCKRKGLVCLVIIYKFFDLCGFYYAKKKDQCFHLQICSDLESHPDSVRKELEEAIQMMYKK